MTATCMPWSRLCQRRGRDNGSASCCVPYITGGLGSAWADWLVRGGRRAPAPTPSRSGFPFSDPVMDGPVIQQASKAALDAGATPEADPRPGWPASTSAARWP